MSKSYIAYRAIGFRTCDLREVNEMLQKLLRTVSITVNIEIRTIAPSSISKDTFTSIFVFKDHVCRPECERSFKLPADEEGAVIPKPYLITIDSNFIGLTILHQPKTKDFVE